MPSPRAVSYTHLDVYKRQVDSGADIAAQMKEQNKQMSVLSLNAAIEAGMLGEQGKLFVEAAAVSYTHLDVYKRQEFNSSS